MIETPKVITLPALATAVIRLRIPCGECPEHFGPAVHEIMTDLARQQIRPAGPVFDHHFSPPDTHFDFEIGLFTAEPIKPSGRILPSHRPAMRAAVTTLHGDYEGLPEAWPEFMLWISSNRLEPAQDFWQIFVKGPESSGNPSDWRTELICPLKNSSSSPPEMDVL